MTKLSFKDWYLSLSERTQQYVRNILDDEFTEYTESFFPEKIFEEWMVAGTLRAISRGSSCLSVTERINLVYDKVGKEPGINMVTVKRMLIGYFTAESTYQYVPVELRHKRFMQRYKRVDNSFRMLLLATDDFNDLRKHAETLYCPSYGYEMLEILGRDLFIKKIQDGGKLNVCMSDPILYELLFTDKYLDAQSRNALQAQRYNPLYNFDFVIQDAPIYDTSLFFTLFAHINNGKIKTTTIWHEKDWPLSVKRLALLFQACLNKKTTSLAARRLGEYASLPDLYNYDVDAVFNSYKSVLKNST